MGGGRKRLLAPRRERKWGVFAVGFEPSRVGQPNSISAPFVFFFSLFPLPSPPLSVHEHELLLLRRRRADADENMPFSLAQKEKPLAPRSMPRRTRRVTKSYGEMERVHLPHTSSFLCSLVWYVGCFNETRIDSKNLPLLSL